MHAALKRRHEPRRLAADEERRLARAGDRIGLAAEPEGVAVVAPLRLDDLELPRDRGLHADEQQPALLAVVLRAVRQLRPVRHAPAQDPMTRAQAALPLQGVAGIRAANVRAARALQP